MKLSLTFSVLAATFGCSAAQTIFDAIATAGNYSTLLGALESSGADDLLGGVGGPVTLFGPNDAAFAAISDALVGLNSDQLLGVLATHAVLGEFTASAVIAAGCVELTTIAGTELGVSYSEADGVMVNGATVVLADVTGEGGIMHGIDSVLLGEFTPCPTEAPTSSPTDEYESFLDSALATGSYSILLGTLVSTPGIIEAVEAVLPVTVFGPNDGAFTALGDSFAQLAANETALFDILAGHVVQGAFTAAQVRAAGCVELDTLAGTKLKVEFNEDHDHSALAGHTGAMGAIMVNEAHILDEDLSGEDGVFHGIEKVILPGTFTPCPTTAPTAAPEDDSAASVVSTSVAMVAAVAAFFAF